MIIVWLSLSRTVLVKSQRKKPTFIGEYCRRTFGTFCIRLRV
uniref:Hypotheticial protein n=1 Tax=Schistosoma japonicum TaxID=6182 RepID=C1L6T1_SCHJA|nr:hypotheticial protein [Schistosoma japonicum]CAX75100.1 hypotheticial protein [Schistosoma japonicum]CAX75101.1 hypotheticial protein [Schistosoma japonicum]